uniref:Uncharacterized protein n=1 Tax=Romanomermis culicivorax TaxID=13658 RepID=A0A915KL13_ROMCU
MSKIDLKFNASLIFLLCCSWIVARAKYTTPAGHLTFDDYKKTHDCEKDAAKGEESTPVVVCETFRDCCSRRCSTKQHHWAACNATIDVHKQVHFDASTVCRCS